MEKFKEFMENSSLTKNTINSYDSDVKLFKKFYFDSYGESLREVIHSDIIAYRNYLLRHNFSTSTINRKLAALKQYNMFLINIDIQKNIVISKKDYIKVQSSIMKKSIPTDKEMNRLLHIISKAEKNSKRDYCLIIIMCKGGLRELEAVKIRLTDIKLEERILNIIGKGNKFRQVIINNDMYDAIKEYLEERCKLNTENPYLFVGQKNINTKESLNRNFCNRILEKYNRFCNITNLHPHILRALFCTNALHQAGYSLAQVANQAGHNSFNTTKRYLVTNEVDILDKANKL